MNQTHDPRELGLLQELKELERRAGLLRMELQDIAVRRRELQDRRAEQRGKDAAVFDTRDQVTSLVAARPGITMKKLMAETGLSPTACRNRLVALAGQRVITLTQDRRSGGGNVLRAWPVRNEERRDA